MAKPVIKTQQQGRVGDPVCSVAYKSHVVRLKSSALTMSHYASGLFLQPCVATAGEDIGLSLSPNTGASDQAESVCE